MSGNIVEVEVNATINAAHPGLFCGLFKAAEGSRDDETWVERSLRSRRLAI